MKNKAITGLALATNDSLKGLKKLLGSTALATTLVATSIFTGLTPSANAGDIAVANNAIVSADDSNGNGSGTDTIAVGNNLVFAQNATIATEAALIDVAEVESGTGDSVITLTGTGGLLADVLTATHSLAMTVNTNNTFKLNGNAITASDKTTIIDLVDDATMQITAASISSAAVTADADGDGTFTISAATTQNITVGSASLDIGVVNVNALTSFGATAIVHARDINITANTDFTVDVFANTIDLTGTGNDTTTVTIGDKLTKANGATSILTMNATGQKVIVDGGDTLAGDLRSATDGFGEIEVTGDATFTGNLGTSTTVKVGTVDLNGDVSIQKMVFANATTVANTKTLTVGGAVANLVYTGTVNGDAAGQGTIVVNNSTAQATAINFTGALGNTAELAVVTLTTDADFQSSVKANEITVAASKIGSFLGDVIIGANDLTSTGTSLFAGTGTQTLTSGGAAELLDGTGTVSITNTSNGGVVFDTLLISANTLDLSIGAGARAVFTENAHTVEELAVAALGVLKLDETIVNGDIVFTTTTAQDDDSFVATSKIKLPSNLVGGQSITLLKTVKSAGGAADADTVTAVDSALVDTFLVDYVATATEDDVTVTANDRSNSSVASQGKITINEAIALRQLRASMNAGSTLERATFTNMMTEENGLSTVDASALAKQAAPQLDTISGSTVATRAMTGTVQGIVSNRMASLRSGDAFVTGVSAGNGMSANSGFIQAFGSESEQKNESSLGVTTFGFDSETSGLAIGFDGMTDDGSTLGLSASYSTTDVDGKGTGKSKNSIDSYTVSVYGDKATEFGYLEGSLTYGINDNTASRLVNSAGLSRSYTANYDSNHISLKVGGGVPQEVMDSAFVTPFMSATATTINTDAYTEKSSLADDNLRLRVAQDDINSLVGSLGVKAHMVTDNGTPMISLAVNNEFGDSEINSQNTYQGGGTKFKTTTEVEELSATLGLGFSFGNDVTSLNINYEANANEDDYVSQYGSVKIVAKF